jgi:glycosyltransferase involved in cell wall biosynthesis
MTLNRFYVDLSPLGQRSTGVTIYSVALAQRLEQEFRCEVIAPPYLCQFFNRPCECPPPATVKGIAVSRNFWSPRWKHVMLGPETLVYAPHMKGFYFQERQIITIHDLIHHFHRTRNFVENTYNSLLLPRIVRRIRGVFTVSETVKQQLCDFYHLPVDRVQVVPNGIDLTRWRPASEGRTPAEKYLLTVSANRPYKNTLELLDLHRLWAAKYRLKIVSSKARYGTAIRERVRIHGLSDRVDFLDDLDEGELIEVYRSCAALVYASTMEGFGRPALEAMAVGRPVILSDIPVHRETFADAAIFIIPGQAGTWEAAFDALDNAPKVQERIARGLRIAAGFSWQQSGHRLIEMLLRMEPELQGLRR